MDEHKKIIVAERIEAQYIVLVDTKGRERASLFCSDTNGYPESTVIRIMGSDGNPKLELQVDGVSPGIRLSTPQQSSGISIAVNETSNGLMICNNEGVPVVQMGMYHDPEYTGHGSKPTIVLRDALTGEGWTAVVGEGF